MSARARQSGAAIATTAVSTRAQRVITAASHLGKSSAAIRHIEDGKPENQKFEKSLAPANFIGVQVSLPMPTEFDVRRRISDTSAVSGLARAPSVVVDA